MAHPVATTRLFTELSRNRSSLPRAEDYATAGSIGSLTINNDAVIHSTAQMGDFTTEQQLPQWNQHPEPSENGTEGSEDMSIEMGRGMKRSARNGHDDMSSNLVFELGDSQYEVTDNPPIRARSNVNKASGMLRRDAAVRRANEAVKTTDALKRKTSASKHRSLSEMLANQLPDTSFNGEEYAQPTATFNTKNTRFSRSRQASGLQPSRLDGTPQRTAINNPIVQSASQTVNSFMLPDLPNITELVSGTRKDGTPIFSRTTKSRSRFTPANNKSLRSTHIPLQSIPVPDDEKAIFASLQLLKDKVAYLEAEKSESDKRAEEYEGEIIDLRSQLEVTQRRSDSALGSDEEDNTQARWRMEKIRFQASVKALQDHLDRSERKISVSEIAVKRVTKERDELVTQIGVAYYNNEELKAENETFRETFDQMQAENEDLKDEIEVLRRENQQLRATTGGGRVEKQEAAIRSKKEGRHSRKAANDRPELDMQEDLASRIAREVQLRRDAAAAVKGPPTDGTQEATRQTSGRSRSKSQSRRQTSGTENRSVAGSKRTVSAPLKADFSDADSTTELEMTNKTRNTLKNMRVPVEPTHVREEDSRDITFLSALDPNAVANLRRKLEQELQAKKQIRNASASAPAQAQAQRDDTSRSMPRKSSLKDITAGLDMGTGTFKFRDQTIDEMTKAAKSVRVQSPHTSDASGIPNQENETEDVSMMSNTSRRRRAASADGMTSAFIIPDITMHSTQLPTTVGKSCIQHRNAGCTACHPGDKSIEIPVPVPVSQREIATDVDVTSATIRPAQSPPIALATIIKQLEDEITHLKIKLQKQQQLYSQHVPALSQRKRVLVKSRIGLLIDEIERRSDQVYALYDVLEGQKQTAGGKAENLDDEQVEETLMSIGMNPAEISGRVGRRGPAGLDGANDMSDDDSDELPWEGLSDYESDHQSVQTRQQRRSTAF
ncbi:Hypothetical protein R9X50_00104300 [Acrodontium crateriforme]|uniref:Cep57 centrosome microtubule-binding domain-containing protein n=1 Tax=Acrodontium crateriforme TaxID=150365 RepID=A0AAQ3M1R3_9PEZI|nr:Hypothetical protein R9X50_00104300 [Acrodontium crateriforme]